MSGETIVKKWERPLETIFHMRVHYIDTLADAIAIKDKGARNGREFYVISKDTAKLSCSYRRQ